MFSVARRIDLFSVVNYRCADWCRFRLAALLLVLSVMTACSSPSVRHSHPSPAQMTNPSQAEASVVSPSVSATYGKKFTCPGIPDESVRAMFSADIILDDSLPQGYRVDRHVSYLSCPGVMSSGSQRLAFFSEFGYKATGFEPWVSSFTYNDDSNRELFSVPGVGDSAGEIRFGQDGGATAAVDCGATFVTVTARPIGQIKGNLKRNLANFAISLTPWACKGETIPGLDAPLSPWRAVSKNTQRPEDSSTDS